MSLPGNTEHFFDASFEALTGHRPPRKTEADPVHAAIPIGAGALPRDKLSFSRCGYGSPWHSQYAGLIRRDSLLVHDEAHSGPAFRTEHEERILMKEPS